MLVHLWANFRPYHIINCMSKLLAPTSERGLAPRRRRRWIQLSRQAKALPAKLSPPTDQCRGTGPGTVVPALWTAFVEATPRFGAAPTPLAGCGTYKNQKLRLTTALGPMGSTVNRFLLYRQMSCRGLWQRFLAGFMVILGGLLISGVNVPAVRPKLEPLMFTS